MFHVLICCVALNFLLSHRWNNSIFTCMFGFWPYLLLLMPNCSFGWSIVEMIFIRLFIRFPALSCCCLRQIAPLARLLFIMLQCRGKFFCPFERRLFTYFPVLNTIIAYTVLLYILKNKCVFCSLQKIFRCLRNWMYQFKILYRDVKKKLWKN